MRRKGLAKALVMAALASSSVSAVEAQGQGEAPTAAPPASTAPTGSAVGSDVGSAAGSDAGSAAGSDAGSAAGSGRYDRRLELPSSESYFNDASRLPIAPMIVQPQPTEHRTRPTLWIGGVLVLAAVFLWNRSRRLEHERLEEAASRGARRNRQAAATDEDAADLAAAARAGDDAGAALDEPAGDSPELNAAPRSTPGASAAAAPSASPAPSDPSQEPR